MCCFFRCCSSLSLSLGESRSGIYSHQPDVLNHPTNVCNPEADCKTAADILYPKNYDVYFKLRHFPDTIFARSAPSRKRKAMSSTMRLVLIMRAPAIGWCNHLNPFLLAWCACIIIKKSCEWGKSKGATFQCQMNTITHTHTSDIPLAPSHYARPRRNPTLDRQTHRHDTCARAQIMDADNPEQEPPLIYNNLFFGSSEMRRPGRASLALAIYAATQSYTHLKQIMLKKSLPTIHS